MGIHAAWHNAEKTIIRVDFDEQWTWSDLAAIDRLTDDLLVEVDHKACLLVDMRKARTLPKGLPLRQLRDRLDFAHPHTDLLVVVGINPFIRRMLERPSGSRGVRPTGCASPIRWKQQKRSWPSTSASAPDRTACEPPPRAVRGSGSLSHALPRFHAGRAHSPESLARPFVSGSSIECGQQGA